MTPKKKFSMIQCALNMYCAYNVLKLMIIKSVPRQIFFHSGSTPVFECRYIFIGIYPRKITKQYFRKKFNKLLYSFDCIQTFFFFFTQRFYLSTNMIDIAIKKYTFLFYARSQNSVPIENLDFTILLQIIIVFSRLFFRFV